MPLFIIPIAVLAGAAAIVMTVVAKARKRDAVQIKKFEDAKHVNSDFQPRE